MWILKAFFLKKEKQKCKLGQLLAWLELYTSNSCLINATFAAVCCSSCLQVWIWPKILWAALSTIHGRSLGPRQWQSKHSVTIAYNGFNTGCSRPLFKWTTGRILILWRWPCPFFRNHMVANFTQFPGVGNLQLPFLYRFFLFFPAMCVGSSYTHKAFMLDGLFQVPLHIRTSWTFFWWKVYWGKWSPRCLWQWKFLYILQFPSLPSHSQSGENAKVCILLQIVLMCKTWLLTPISADKRIKWKAIEGCTRGPITPNLLERHKAFQICWWCQELLQAFNTELYTCQECSATISTWSISYCYCKHLLKIPFIAFSDFSLGFLQYSG